MEQIRKLDLLESGAYGEFVGLLRAAFSVYRGNDDEDTYKLLYNRFIEKYGLSVYTDCKRLKDSQRSKQKGLRRKLLQFSKIGYVYFVTFTFKDEVLTSTTEASRRQILRRYLSSKDILFIANQDFGDKNGREHYHASICVQNKLEGTYKEHHGNSLYDCPFFAEWQENRGHVLIQGPIDFSKDENGNNLDSLKIAKYISKLSNHALKESTLKTSLVFSRKNPSWHSCNYDKFIENPSDQDDKDQFLTLTDEDLAMLPFDFE